MHVSPASAGIIQSIDRSQHDQLLMLALSFACHSRNANLLSIQTSHKASMGF
jgi:hypothetical protein